MNKFEDQPIDFVSLINIILNKKKFVALITSAFLIISFLFSLYLPNVYTSNAILVPTSLEDSMSSKLSSYSSLAGLTGISIPGENNDMSQEAIERIKSFEFFSQHFVGEIKLENMMAAKRWNANTNSIIYNKNLYDDISKKWVRKEKAKKKSMPSHQEAYEEYKRILKISEDKKTSFVYISIDHISPIISQRWTELIIKNINESMRERDKEIAESSINFLYESSNKTNFQSLKEVISKLLESEMQTLMLASVTDAYVFKVLESPIIPEKESGPKRALICFMGLLLGLTISITSILFQRSINLTKESLN